MNYLAFVALWLAMQQVPTAKTTFHNCSIIGSTGNSPHLFDVSEIYQCDEGQIEIAGKWTKTYAKRRNHQEPKETL